MLGRGTGVVVVRPLADVLALAALAPILGLTVRACWNLEHAGALEIFELLPRVGKRHRYSGQKVMAWLDGTLAAPEPAAVSPSKYFAHGARRSTR